MNEKALREALKLYFVMGSANCREEPAEVLKKAIAGGITMFQFREKRKGALTGAEKFALAEELHDICKKAGIPFIVDDDIPLALALNADGVHIGQEDEPIERAREKIGDRILGVSVHRAEEAQAAIEKGADYLGVGPIFPTKTKEDARASSENCVRKDTPFRWWASAAFNRKMPLPLWRPARTVSPSSAPSVRPRMWSGRRKH